MNFHCQPINPFQDDGLSKEDRVLIQAIEASAIEAGCRGDSVGMTIENTLKRVGRYDLLPPCAESEEV